MFVEIGRIARRQLLLHSRVQRRAFVGVAAIRCRHIGREITGVTTPAWRLASIVARACWAIGVRVLVLSARVAPALGLLLAFQLRLADWPCWH